MTPANKQAEISALFEQLKQAYQPICPELAAYRLRFSQTKTVLGSCHYKKRQISISLPILLQNPLELQLDTLKHEFAHALAFAHGERGHGPVWKKWAVQLGATPKSRSQRPVDIKFKYQLVRKKGEHLILLERKYHRKVSLKNKYIHNDKSSLNQLFLVPAGQIHAYMAGELKLNQLTLIQ